MPPNLARIRRMGATMLAAHADIESMLSRLEACYDAETEHAFHDCGFGICFICAERVRHRKNPFQRGIETYRAGDFTLAAKWFGECVARQPSSGGMAKSRAGRMAELATWARRYWHGSGRSGLIRRNAAARANLQFARKTAQLEAPILAWHEMPSTWLSGQYVGVAGRCESLGGRGVDHPARLSPAAPSHLAAGSGGTGLAIFLLSIPAQVGAHTRARIGFVDWPGRGLAALADPRR